MQKNHSFNTDFAKKWGIEEAILLENIGFWVHKNLKNEQAKHDGLFWTYNSVKDFSLQFEYMSEKTIRTALEKLEAQKVLKSAKLHTKSAIPNQMKSYAIIDLEAAEWYGVISDFHQDKTAVPICPFGQSPFAQKGNSICPKGQMYITDIIKTDITNSFSNEKECAEKKSEILAGKIESKPIKEKKEKKVRSSAAAKNPFQREALDVFSALYFATCGVKFIFAPKDIFATQKLLKTQYVQEFEGGVLAGYNSLLEKARKTEWVKDRLSPSIILSSINQVLRAGVNTQLTVTKTDSIAVGTFDAASFLRSKKIIEK